jgi:hypothetical protein
MKRFGQFLLWALMFAIIPVTAHGQTPEWSGVVDPSRAINWSTAGTPGGIPTNLTQCGPTIAAGASIATINGAIAGTGAGYTSCTPPYYIQLGAGSFTLSSGFLWSSRGHVEVRGMGDTSTFVTFTGDDPCNGVYSNVCMRSGDNSYAGAPSNTANWTAGYTQGATSITLDNVSNLQVGWPLVLDQLNDTGATPASGIFICTVTPQCAANGDGGSSRSGRDQAQIVTVTSISGSGPYTVGISPGLYMPNWRSSQTPGAWWASYPAQYDGIRDMYITVTTAQSGVAFVNCVGCYEYRVTSVGPPGRDHAQMFISPHSTIAENYYIHTSTSASVNYGVEALPSSDSLVENNIFEGIQAGFLANGPCSGCVWAYNFEVNNVFGTPSTGDVWQNHDGFLHATDDTELFEGNEGVGIDWDYTHGTHYFNTAFRNVASGYGQNQGWLTTNNYVPLMIDGIDRYANAVGNILGNPALAPGCYISGCGTLIMSIGSGHGDIPDDPFAVTSVMLWGNCDFFNNACLFNSSNVPSSLTPYGNAVPASHTLPPSFYYTSQPSWWPSNIPWPYAGPDVTGGTLMVCMSGVNKAAYITSSGQCPSGTTNNLMGWANPNPAAYCYLNIMGGSPIGTDASALPFDPSSCYGSAAPVTPPQPPENLSATVN